MKGATSIQERLWELRKDKGLNLEELSKLTGRLVRVLCSKPTHRLEVLSFI